MTQTIKTNETGNFYLFFGRSRPFGSFCQRHYSHTISSGVFHLLHRLRRRFFFFFFRHKLFTVIISGTKGVSHAFRYAFVFRLFSSFLLRSLNASRRVNVRRRMCVCVCEKGIGPFVESAWVGTMCSCIIVYVRPFVGSLSISFSHICHFVVGNERRTLTWRRIELNWAWAFSTSTPTINVKQKKTSLSTEERKSTECFEKGKVFTHPNLCLWILITCPIASIYSFKAF